MPFSLICLIYVVGMAILFVELFIPGGFLGVIGVVVLVTSIVLAFQNHPPQFGVALIVISCIVIPAMFVWGLRRITLGESQNVEDGFTSTEEGLEELAGLEGKTITPLRPSGMAKIGDKRVDVVSQNVMIDKDVLIKVVKVEGNQVIVRPVRAEES